MVREMCALLAGPRTLSLSWHSYPYPSLSVVSYDGNSARASTKLHMYFLQGDNVVHVVAALWMVGRLVVWMPFLFSHMEYCDMHFVYGFCDGNARAAVEEYQSRFPNRRIPSGSVFTRIHQTLRDTGSLLSVSVQSEREVVWTINTRENILQMVQRSPHLSIRRMASRIGVSRMQVWRTLHEEDLYPYHDQRVQHLEPGNHAQLMDFCHWIKVHPGLLSVVLFSDEASFTRDGVNNLRNVHTWSHVNPHETSVFFQEADRLLVYSKDCAVSRYWITLSEAIELCLRSTVASDPLSSTGW